METQGVVKLLRKDKKGLQLNDGQWYSSFDKTVDCNVGDEVKITFEQTTKGDRTYNNFTDVETTKKSTIPAPAPVEGYKDKTINTILICAKDLVVASINSNPGTVDVKNMVPVAIDVMLAAERQVKNAL